MNAPPPPSPEFQEYARQRVIRILTSYQNMTLQGQVDLILLAKEGISLPDDVRANILDLLMSLAERFAPPEV